MTAEDKNVTPDVSANHALDDAEDNKAPLWLKMVVVGLGLAIIGMLLLITFTIIGKKDKSAESEWIETADDQRVFENVPVDADLLAEIAVTRPAGSRLVRASSSRFELTLHFSSSRGDVIIIVNRTTGQQSRITVPK